MSKTSPLTKAPSERRTTSLPPRLEAVLARLCKRLGPMTKTKAVKLPYLVDVVARHAHVAEHYGEMDAGKLGTLTKALNTELEASAWGSNHDAGVGEDAYARLADGWQALYEKLPHLDLTDESQWGEPIEDVDEYLKAALSG
jgi:hypothetical protein